MTYIVTTADWHNRNNESYGVYDSSGANSIFLEKIKIEESIINKTIDLNGHLLIAGDFLDSTVVDSITLYHSSRILKKASEKITLTILMEGNHGYQSKDNEYSVISHWKHLLSDNFKIITYPKVVNKDGISYHCVPAVSDIEKIFPNIIKDFSNSIKKNNKNILLIHAPIISAKYDSGKESNSGIRLKHIKDVSNKYDFVVCGDFHRHQFLYKNCWYTGSPMQTSLRDKNQNKGYQIINTKNNKIQFVNTNSIRFLDLEWHYNKKINPLLKEPDLYKSSIKNTIIVIRLFHSSKDDYYERLIKIKKKLIDCGCVRIFVDKKTKDKTKIRKKISSDMSLEEMVKAYVEYNKDILPSSKKKIINSGISYMR